MPDSKQWISENHRDQQMLSFPIKEKLFSQQSQFQKVEIFETTSHGRLLVNDGCFMLSERDEAIYHEMMAHVPLFVHPKPQRVLVIGGGDGGTAREVLRHSRVEQVVMVEIDRVVVEASREYLPQTASRLEDPRLKLVIDDGVKFAREASEKSFDVVLVDSTDPVGPAQPLFGPEFYGDISRLLNEGGIVVAQGESPFYELATQRSMLQVMGGHFPVVMPYNFCNLTYPGGLWSFMWASKGPHPLKDFEPQLVEKLELSLHYYNAEIHRGSFALPQFQRQALSDCIRGA